MTLEAAVWVKMCVDLYFIHSLGNEINKSIQLFFVLQNTTVITTVITHIVYHASDCSAKPV